MRPTTASAKSLRVTFDVCHRGTLIAEGHSTYVAVSQGNTTDLTDTLREATARTPQVALSRNEAKNLLEHLHDAQQSFYGGGPREPLDAVLAADVVWHVPGSSPIAGTYEGIDDVLGYMAARRKLARYTFTMHPREVLLGEEHIAWLTDGMVERGGHQETWSTVGLYRVSGAQISEAYLLPFDQQQFDRIWSSPPP